MLLDIIFTFWFHYLIVKFIIQEGYTSGFVINWVFLKIDVYFLAELLCLDHTAQLVKNSALIICKSLVYESD